MGTASGIPKLIRRGRRYYISIYNSEKRVTERRSLKTEDLAEAKKGLARQLALMENVDRKGLSITVIAALEDYLLDHVFENCAAPRRQEIAATHLAAFFGKTALADVNIPMCRAYAAARRAGKVVSGLANVKGRRASDSTIRRELTTLSSAANHAKKWKRISPADMPSIERTKERGGFLEAGLAGEAKFFSREQIALLLFHARGQTRDIIKLCYYTAARRSSIEEITVGQIDFARKKIDLATPGKKQTKKRQPVVPLFPVLEADLRRLVAGKEPTDRLFKTRQFPYQFNLTCRALGFDEPHNPHMLRHSRATHLLQDGKKPYSVAALLGDTMATVEANYGHHSPSELMEDLK